MVVTNLPIESYRIPGNPGQKENNLHEKTCQEESPWQNCLKTLLSGHLCSETSCRNHKPRAKKERKLNGQAKVEESMVMGAQTSEDQRRQKENMVIWMDGRVELQHE